MPLSGVFYPVDALPRLLQPVSHALPSTHAFNAMRALLDERGLLWDEIALGAASTVVLSLVALGFATKMLMLFRARGYISRYL